MADYRPALIERLQEHGCSFVWSANGSHELWQSPVSGKRFVIQRDLSSKVAANNILKQAGITQRF